MNRTTTSRYSVTALYSLATERDIDVSDELSEVQRKLKSLKAKISAQSKRNFVLEKDLRFIDSRIALLIQNRIALDENDLSRIYGRSEGDSQADVPEDKLRLYGNLFFLLQTSPRYISSLVRQVSLAEIDALLQILMFTIYGNQYESREENLLLTMFQSVLASQFERTVELNAQIRANTPVSRLMTTYTRRGPGQAYLRSLLSPILNPLLEQKDRNLEINPLRVYTDLVQECALLGKPLPEGVPDVSPTYKEASENAVVQDIIAPRVQSLLQIGDTLVPAIVDSLHSVPYGIRWICKQIRSLTRRKYPDASDDSVCSLIGGFFFLRFVNPAIVSPQSYMLVDAPPADMPRRTLVLLAKMVQNIANKPSYSKEPYMATLDKFREKHQVVINRFCNELCEVGDFYEQLELDKYVALSRTDLDVNVTVNEMYSLHAQLLRHLDEIDKGEVPRSPFSDAFPTEENSRRGQQSPLRDLLNELGPPPPLAPRAENRSYQLPLASRYSHSVDNMDDGLDVPANELLYIEAKSVFVHILRSLPAARIPGQAINFEFAANLAGKSTDSGLVRKGLRALDLLHELHEVHLMSAPAVLSSLSQEIEQELAHLGSLRSVLESELKSLKAVHGTLCEHHEYLSSQLETYQAYLENVRAQSSSTGVTEQSSFASKQGNPVKFTHQRLEKDGLIIHSSVPENRRSNMMFTFASPTPGTFTVSITYKGRKQALLQLDLNLEDLLDMQKQGVRAIDLEYVHFSVPRLTAKLNENFNR